MRMTTLITVSIALTVAALGARAAAAPPFQPLTYAQATEQASNDGRVVMLYFTADWCSPCQLMKRDTWPDAALQQSIAERAVAIEVNADQRPDLARRFQVRQLPTIVLTRDRRPIAQRVGYANAMGLRLWLEMAAPAAREETMAARQFISSGRLAFDAGRFIEAAEAYASAIRAALDDADALPEEDLRFILEETSGLAKLDADARTLLAALRDECAARLGEGRAALIAWTSLNDALGDSERTIAWWDAIRAEPDATARVGPVREALAELLLENGRWADAGRLLLNPIRDAQQALSSALSRDGAPMTEEARRTVTRQRMMIAAERVAALYVACLASNRVDEADALAEMLAEHVGATPARLALVRAALDAGVASELHLGWLDGARGIGDAEELRERVRRALLERVGVDDGEGPR